MESLERTRERAELGMGTLREALALLASGNLYMEHPASDSPVGYLRPGADYLLENYGNTNIYSETYAEEDSLPVYHHSQSEKIVKLELEVKNLRRENEKLANWKQNIVQLCVDLGAEVQDWKGGDTTKGFAHYFISSLYTRAVKAEALAVPVGWLNSFFQLQQEARKKLERETPLRAH